MSKPCTVIIGALELLDALRESAGEDNEVLTFSDNEPLKALEAITTRQPTVVALERLFAATSRGAALINRIKADPALASCEIRIVAHDSNYTRVSPRRPADPSAAPPVAVEEPPGPASPNLDWRGTRRAPRFKMLDGLEVTVDGK